MKAAKKVKSGIRTGHITKKDGKNALGDASRRFTILSQRENYFHKKRK